MKNKIDPFVTPNDELYFPKEEVVLAVGVAVTNRDETISRELVGFSMEEKPGQHYLQF